MNHNEIKAEFLDRLISTSTEYAYLYSPTADAFDPIVKKITKGIDDYTSIVNAKDYFEDNNAQDVISALKAKCYSQYMSNTATFEILSTISEKIDKYINQEAYSAIQKAHKALSSAGDFSEVHMWLDGLRSSNLMAELHIKKAHHRELLISATYSDDRSVRKRETVEIRHAQAGVALIEPLIANIGFDVEVKAAPKMFKQNPREISSIVNYVAIIKKHESFFMRELYEFATSSWELGKRHELTPHIAVGKPFFVNAIKVLLSIHDKDKETVEKNLRDFKNEAIESIKYNPHLPGYYRALIMHKVMDSYQRMLPVIKEATEEIKSPILKEIPYKFTDLRSYYY
ncbi:hypothetical protein ACI2KR_27465 [Pseudomonas luteola]